MDEEALQELDRILKPIVERSYQTAKRQSHNGVPSGHAVLERFRMELDHTKVALSNQFHKIDQFMSVDDSASQYYKMDRAQKRVGQQPKVDQRKYVREANGGYQVYNGMQWVQVSKEATIELKIESNWETNHKTAVILKANDSKTNTYVRYIDNDIHKDGFDYSYTGDKMGSEGVSSSLPSRYMYWEDPYYNTVKKGIGITGRTAGALGARHIGNLTPWRSGSDLQFAKGWYRNKEGIYRKLSSQKGLGAGGHQVGARNAVQRAKGFKAVGRRLFYIGAAISTYQGVEAYWNDDSNKQEVATKAVIDVFIGYIGMIGGPVGWAISGTYFVLDVSGAFGDWGQPSGVRSDGVPYNTNRSNYDHEIEFTMEYIESMKEKEQRRMMELQLKKIDNTRVVKPRILFKKN